MKTSPALLTIFLAVLPWTALECTTQAMLGQAFSGSIEPAASEGGLAASSTTDSVLYANGTRAINEGRWSDAAAIFDKVAQQRGAHADGALYWKAYAENKQGQSKSSLSTCAMLRREYRSSS